MVSERWEVSTGNIFRIVSKVTEALLKTLDYAEDSRELRKGWREISLERGGSNVIGLRRV